VAALVLEVLAAPVLLLISRVPESLMLVAVAVVQMLVRRIVVVLAVMVGEVKAATVIMGLQKLVQSIQVVVVVAHQDIPLQVLLRQVDQAS
jgi:hypothetical protein